MRIKAIVALSFAGAATAAVIAGGAAYASGVNGDEDADVRIVYEDNGYVPGAATDSRDCPEKDGSGQSGDSAGETDGGTGSVPSEESL
ncbi:hypothetical protein K1W54_29975 [Micromonospora sp. CPCC 205371]|nr:hypothetical protein [Micromonospora sp. CPCC 205371]